MAVIKIPILSANSKHTQNSAIMDGSDCFLFYSSITYDYIWNKFDWFEFLSSYTMTIYQNYNLF